ncbi:MAG: tRNA preQ1(34) S-adenosylmethionine ribosyltransferase-isomerase QueA [Betaproteobacteria bacterium]|nr:tRNA preQ1(34) S-adenosylmethionine ribosyltransferase-isomerase QueA [Betaproteobacteria bacterium]
MLVSDFDFTLPEELIAQEPAPERSGSRLLHVNGTAGEWVDGRFKDLPSYLRPGDLLVFNDTRVINARLYGHKESGGRIELLLERILGDHLASAHIRASHAPRVGGRLVIDPDIPARVEARHENLYTLRFEAGSSILALLERHGHLPLPPYIQRPDNRADAERYQTVYARHPGAVAAPTAGLHFDGAMLESLQQAGIALSFVTLHVGSGTFQPVRAEHVEAHRMHSECFHVPESTVQAIERARQNGGRVVAVGTTSLRALEAAAQGGALCAGHGETDIFIVPGYRFRVVDRLLTNFHLPRSTLLMLVSAFGGHETMRRAYAHAVDARYRFFSYGDAMLIDRQDG